MFSNISLVPNFFINRERERERERRERERDGERVKEGDELELWMS